MANILLIEPNAVLASTYERALTEDGHLVARVAGAQAAVNAADTRVPDLVILELQLSGHSGIEFLHEFRSYPEWQQIPVIINTAINPSVMAGVQETFTQSLGVRAILYKPKASLEDILLAVREQLVVA